MAELADALDSGSSDRLGHAGSSPVSRMLVDGGGFEPPKSATADLQSAPFGHSGTYPRLLTYRRSWRRDLNPQPADYKSAALPIELHQRIELSLIEHPGL